MGVSRSGGEWSCQQAFAKFYSAMALSLLKVPTTIAFTINDQVSISRYLTLYCTQNCLNGG